MEQISILHRTEMGTILLFCGDNRIKIKFFTKFLTYLDKDLQILEKGGYIQQTKGKYERTGTGKII